MALLFAIIWTVLFYTYPRARVCMFACICVCLRLFNPALWLPHYNKPVCVHVTCRKVDLIGPEIIGDYILGTSDVPSLLVFDAYHCADNVMYVCVYTCRKVDQVLIVINCQKSWNHWGLSLPPIKYWGMSNVYVFTATGWRPMAGWGGDVSASCTVGPIVR